MDIPAKMSGNGKPRRGKPVDRRIRKTRQVLSDALVSLMLEKGYDRISIRDIIDKANVGRSTFYLHYENKDQLLLWGHDHFRNLILEDREGADEDRSPRRRIDFLDLYLHVADHGELGKALLSQKGLDTISRYLADIMGANIRKLYGKGFSKSRDDGKVFPLMADAAASALVKLLFGWLEKGLPIKPEKMAERSQQLLDGIFGTGGEGR